MASKSWFWFIGAFGAALLGLEDFLEGLSSKRGWVSEIYENNVKNRQNINQNKKRFLTSKASMSLITEEQELFFFLGGLTGAELPPQFSLKTLEATDIQVTPFLFFGFISLAFMWAIKLLYRVAAITIASSDVWQTKPWHSSCLWTPTLRMTTANKGEWDSSAKSFFSLGSRSRKRVCLSMLSGSVINGRNA